MLRQQIRSASVFGLAFALAACSDAPTEPLRFAEPSLAVSSAALVSDGSSEASLGGLAFTCTGEPVAITGTIGLRWHITQLPAGDWMMTQHARITASGVGALTGVKYLRRGNLNASQVFAAPRHGAFTFTQIFRVLNIVQGSADNDAFLVYGKWTINAVGNVSVDVFKVEFECRG